MIKRTLYFGSPAYLSCKDRQLVIEFREEQLEIQFYETKNDKYSPPSLLRRGSGGGQVGSNMLKWANSVKSGDPDNLEARAAAYYWKVLFNLPEIESTSPPLWGGRVGLDFYRSRTGPSPNNLLNYGYAILRAIVARSLVAAGLLPTLGIHHHNKYNAYCLADDIMEPFRPFLDMLVCKITNNGKEALELTPNIKKQLLEISSVDIYFEETPFSSVKSGVNSTPSPSERAGVRSPLMVGLHRTASSLAKCFEGSLRKINYPKLTSPLSPPY